MPDNLPKGNPVPEDVLRRLYIVQKKSLAEIADSLHISVHKVTYWKWKYKIASRSISEAVYLKYNSAGDPFSIKTDLDPEEIKLKFLALGLYWGEGTKSGCHGIKISNTDPILLKHFQNFLIKIFGIDPAKIHYYLQIFRDANSDDAKKYWARHLNISEGTILVSSPLPSLGKGTYRRINLFGVMTMCFFNTKLRNLLFNELNALGFTGGYSVRVEAKKMIK